MKGSEPCRVMIVDDETLIRQGIKHYFNWEEEGFLIVGEASNGQEALELLDEVQPHILITDIVMPIMDGEELTKIVKANYPHIEVIVLSSFGEFEYVRSSFQSGVVDYILKPKLDSENLLAVLKTAVQRIPDFQITNKTKDASISIDQLIDKLISGFDVSENIEEVQNSFPNEAFYLLGVDLSRNPTVLGEVKELVEWAFSEIMDEAISYYMKAEKDSCFYLLNVKEKDIVHVVPKIKECSERQPNIGFVLTEPFSNFTEIGEMYKRWLLPLFQYRFYVPDKQVVLQSDIMMDKESPLIFN
ncbi:response regulator [Alkalihalobacterium bogoriense]|uniref:response regulator n=1 Tax=Alkalihalobacterium bogoriense TaxID=246272 RepID=UPI0006882711|nr:response regulator [Alkalihalobacterium bogoriense]